MTETMFIEASFSSTTEEKEKQDHENYLLASVNYIPSLIKAGYYSEDRTLEYHKAVSELQSMGESGLKLIFDGVTSGRLKSHWAFSVIQEFSSVSLDKKLEVAKKLIEGELTQAGEFTDHGFLGILNTASDIAKEKKIDFLLEVADGRLNKIKKLLDNNSEVNDFDVSLIISHLLTETAICFDRIGLSDMSHKYLGEFNKRHTEYLFFKAQLDEFLKNRKAKIKTSLGPIYEVKDVDSGVVISEEIKKTVEEAVSILEAGTAAGSMIVNLARTKIHSFGPSIAPFLYDLYKEGRLGATNLVLMLLNSFNFSQVSSVYINMLLDQTMENKLFMERELLHKILSSPDVVDRPKIALEFMRKSALFYEEADSPEQKLLARTRYVLGKKFLLKYFNPNTSEDFSTEELQKAGPYIRECLSKFTLIYPELPLVSYELGESMPKLGAPEVTGLVEKIKETWSHSRVYIRGSALYAKLLNRGHDKVRDVDIFVTHSDSVPTDSSMRVLNLKTADELSMFLTESEFDRVSKWIKSAGYNGLKINLVRVPESNLVLEESFVNEPKLLLCDLELDSSGTVYEGDPWEKYNNGEYYINQDFPETLVPNGNLSRALRLMDLSLRFELPCDYTLLKEAEEAIKSGGLILSSVPLNRLSEQHELASSNSILDPTFIKIFEDKNLRKPLLKQFPRLGQLSEEIVRVGGVENYIANNFGRVYLQTKGFVRLYDPNLVNSPAPLNEQKRFIELWYSAEEIKDFLPSSITKESGDVAIPKPESIDALTDKVKLEKAKNKRAQKNLFLEKAVGTFCITAENSDPLILRQKIDNFLEVMNLEWPATVGKDKSKVTQTLIKLGMHSKNPVLKQFDSKAQHKVDLIISADPLDILQASTDKPWHSCTCLKGESLCEKGGTHYPDSTYADLENGAVVAYVMDGKKFVSRVMVRAGFAMDNFEPAAAIEKMYGDARYRALITRAVKEILSDQKIKVDTPMMTYPYDARTYFDSASGKLNTGNHLYYTQKFDPSIY